MHAKNEMKLGQREKDGATLRQHLESVARQHHGKMPEEFLELTAIPCPPLLRYLWKAFLELSGARGRGADGSPEAIPYTELEAWMRLTKRSLNVWEVEVLKRLDVLFLNMQAEQADKKT